MIADLPALVQRLRSRSGVESKRDIGRAVGPFARAGTADDAGQPGLRLGDDTAALAVDGRLRPAADGEAHLLFAIEGLSPGFVAQDPWFAGYCGVMVNLSDIAAMGGHPLAVTNAVWSKGLGPFAEMWAGLQAAAERYGVPIVGGHTNVQSDTSGLAVSVVGRAGRGLLTSFDAAEGDDLVVAVDLRGAYREPNDFFDASTGVADPARLRADLALLPALAEAGLAHAGKDISMAGVLGSALMLLESSGVGARIDLGRIPRPADVVDETALERWLVSFPSFGYVLAVRPGNTAQVCARFEARGLAAAAVGRVQPGACVEVQHGAATARYWDHAYEPLMNLGRTPAPAAPSAGTPNTTTINTTTPTAPAPR